MYHDGCFHTKTPREVQHLEFQLSGWQLSELDEFQGMIGRTAMKETVLGDVGGFWGRQKGLQIIDLLIIYSIFMIS